MDEKAKKNLETEFSFWKWWFTHGILKLVNIWLVIHILIGLCLSYFVPLSINDASLVVVVPFVGILFGLSLAWVGNAMSILDSIELQKLSTKLKHGIKEYLYSYQASILILLFSLIIWAMVAFKIDDLELLQTLPFWIRFCGRTFLFFLASLCIRVCWQLVLSAQWLLLSKSKIFDMEN